jgi:Ca2+/Na+ antiporter
MNLVDGVGAGVFVTCCVVGAVALVDQASLSRGPILRDVSFYFVVSSFMLFVMFTGSFSLWESCGLLLAYSLYVVLYLFALYMVTWSLGHLVGVGKLLIGWLS